ncbi:MAG TPA: ATP-binding cassette domain-containing protein, partial [bacterium]|nr:ATP-binding cassette domain-containing protein [bacterium]
RDIRQVQLNSLRTQIGLVPQSVILFNDTIRSNIAYGCDNARQEDVEKAARLANAHDFITGFPDGYDTMVGERGAQLSGGQAQRISIARALFKDPPILIFDEATSSLDSESELLIRKAMDNLILNRTTFIIAHRLSTVLHADQIIVLDKAKVAGIGKHEQLLESNPIYRRLYELQFKPER